MCGPVSIASAVIGVAGGVMSAKNSATQEGRMIDAQRRQQHEMVKANNWANADALNSVRDHQESTRAQLTDTNIERMMNMSTLSTAISESAMRGNTMDRLENVQNLQYDMQHSDTLLNYTRDYQAIFAGRVGAAESTKAQIQGMAPIPQTSNLTHLVNIGKSGLSGASAGMSFSGGFAKPEKPLEGTVDKTMGSVRGTAGLDTSGKKFPKYKEPFQ